MEVYNTLFGFINQNPNLPWELELRYFINTYEVL